MYNGLLHAHSGLRWLVLVLLIAAIVHAFMKKDVGLNNQNRKLALFAMISVHVQLLIGLVLYFISPKVQFSGDVMTQDIGRFYTIEHLLGMLLAIAIITVGNIKGKKTESFKPILIYYLIGLVLILVSIPWPFRNLGAGMY